MRLVWLVSLALTGSAVAQAQSFCFYQDSDGSPKPIACPEASQLPAPPKKGLVWLAVGDHYDPKVLLRWKPAPGQVPSTAKSSLDLPAGFTPKNGLVQETPGINAYDFDSIQIQDGKAVPLAFHAPPKAAAQPAPGAVELQSAQEHLANGDAMGAIADADQSIEVNPTPQAYLVRAKAKNSMGDFKEALQDASEGLKLTPRDPDLLVAQNDALTHINQQNAAPLAVPDVGKASPAPVVAPQPADTAQAPRFPPRQAAYR